MCSTSIYTKTQWKEPFLRSARSDKQTKTMPRNRQNVENKIQKKSIGKERLALRITMHFTATMSRVPTKYMTANNDHTHMCTWLTLWFAQLDPTMGGLVILSNSSWNDETLALPGEGATKLAGVGGCELTPSYNEHTHHHFYVYLPLLQPTQSTFISPDFMSDFTFPFFSLLPSYFGHFYLSIIKHYFFLIKKKERKKKKYNHLFFRMMKL